jgi:outer membrane immunogenic protein
MRGFITLGLMVLPTAAMAADLPMKAPPAPAPVYSWSGCYLGGGAGYGMWNQDITALDSLSPAIPLTVTTTAGGRGWFGTVQVGCDYQFSGSNWVIGAFTDWDFGGVNGTASIPGFELATREHQKWSWAVGGRLGYVVMPNFLVYVSGGYTEAHFNASELVDVLDGDPTFTHLSAHTYTGWFIGTGYEYGLQQFVQWWPGLFWKTEYRWSEFRSTNLPFVDDISGIAFNEGIHSRKIEQAIRSELVWRFNWGGGPVRASY